MEENWKTWKQKLKNGWQLCVYHPFLIKTTKRLKSVQIKC